MASTSPNSGLLAISRYPCPRAYSSDSGGYFLQKVMPSSRRTACGARSTSAASTKGARTRSALAQSPAIWASLAKRTAVTGFPVSNSRMTSRFSISVFSSASVR